MNKKYEFVEGDEIATANGKPLKRIRSLVAIPTFGVKAGDIGGYIEAEKCLHVSGDAWVSGNARVYGDARVSGDAMVYGDANVYGYAWVSGDAKVYGDAMVYGNVWVAGDSFRGIE